MKFLSSTVLASLMGERQLRRNLKVVARYLLLLLAVIALYTVVFHFIMWNVEGQRHSWLTGLYWTMVTMTTLGFGDVTFATDIGRAFSVLVLLSGVILLLIVLPFVFIRYFYAPWLDAQVRRRAPKEVPEETTGHVLLTAWDSMAEGLAARLRLLGIPYYVVVTDPAEAARLHDEGVSVVRGDVESRATYELARAAEASLVLVNGEDTANSNVVLTVREVAPEVRVAAVANLEDSVDILELAGATHVLALKQRLGEHLAGRVNAGRAEAHVIGSFRELRVAEFSVHGTPMVGKTLRECRLREATGLNVVGIWEGARMLPAVPDHRLSEGCVPVVVGTEEQIRELDEILAIYDANPNPLLIIGGGKVGRSAARALKRRGVPVHMIEKKEELRSRIGDLPDRLFIGDAAHRELLMEAGLETAPSVLLTTNDDAMNIYLTVYCRRLNPELRIVCRITHERNVEAIRRAGADLAVSYAALGVEAVQALLQGRELLFLGEGVELAQVEVPAALEGKTLAESDVRARTGLNVIAVERPSGEAVTPGPEHRLEAGARLVMIGEPGRLEAFLEAYG